HQHRQRGCGRLRGGRPARTCAVAAVDAAAAGDDLAGRGGVMGDGAEDASAGAVRLRDGRVRFHLWAPDAEAVELQLAGQWLPMARDGEGTYATTAKAEAGARYLFRIDGEHSVPDPASRWQPDGIDGPSAVYDPAHYRWRNAARCGRPWHDAVLYELHVGTCGGYRGVRAQLARLAALGITAIELM